MGHYIGTRVFAYSSSGTTTITNVRIGDDVLEDIVPDSKEHICGDAYPMYGAIKGLSKETSPDIEMHHLAALVAVKVINKTPGIIKIDDIEFGMPKIVSKDPISQKKTTIEATNIVGECTINLSGETPSTTANGTNAYPVTKACLDKTYELKSGGDTIVYMAVCPVKTKDKTISIKVNGSQRTLKMTKDVLNPGMVTTFKVEVKELIAPQETNAVNTITSQCRKNTKGEMETVKIVPDFGTPISSMVINGQNVTNLYKVSSGQTLTIQGFAKDMINAMPISFNVSAYDNHPAAMTIHTVNAYMPEYQSSWGSKDYSKLVERVPLANMSVLSIPVIGKLIKAALSYKGLDIDNGIQRNELIKFVDPNTITFNNLAVNGYLTNENVIVLNEDATNKSLTSGLIDTFLKNKFSLDQSKPASYVGLYAILNATYSNGKFSYSAYQYDNGKTVMDYTADQMKAEAEQTAGSIYNKIKSVLDNKGAGDLIRLFADDATHLMHILRDVKVEIKIQPYPYAENYDKDPTTGVNPLILWGLNAAGTTN